MNSNRHVAIVFKTRYAVQDPCHRLAITGSIAQIGSWNHDRCVIADESPNVRGNWSAKITVPVASIFEWKWIVVTEDRRFVVRWETIQNRTSAVGVKPGEIMAPWDGETEFTPITVPREQREAPTTEPVVVEKPRPAPQPEPQAKPVGILKLSRDLSPDVGPVPVIVEDVRLRVKPILKKSSVSRESSPASPDKKVHIEEELNKANESRISAGATRMTSSYAAGPAEEDRVVHAEENIVTDELANAVCDFHDVEAENHHERSNRMSIKGMISSRSGVLENGPPSQNDISMSSYATNLAKECKEGGADGVSAHMLHNGNAVKIPESPEGKDNFKFEKVDSTNLDISIVEKSPVVEHCISNVFETHIDRSTSIDEIHVQKLILCDVSPTEDIDRSTYIDEIHVQKMKYHHDIQSPSAEVVARSTKTDMREMNIRDLSMTEVVDRPKLIDKIHVQKPSPPKALLTEVADPVTMVTTDHRDQSSGGTESVSDNLDESHVSENGVFELPNSVYNGSVPLSSLRMCTCGGVKQCAVLTNGHAPIILSNESSPVDDQLPYVYTNGTGVRVHERSEPDEKTILIPKYVSGDQMIIKSDASLSYGMYTAVQARNYGYAGNELRNGIIKGKENGTVIMSHGSKIKSSPVDRCPSLDSSGEEVDVTSDDEVRGGVKRSTSFLKKFWSTFCNIL